MTAIFGSQRRESHSFIAVDIGDGMLGIEVFDFDRTHARTVLTADEALALAGYLTKRVEEMRL